MDLDRLKQDVGATWKWLADGWRNISDKATNALTYFTPSRESDQESAEGLRWGFWLQTSVHNPITCLWSWKPQAWTKTTLISMSRAAD